MSHPGHDDSNSNASGEPAAPTYPGAPDNFPIQPDPAPAPFAFSAPPVYSPPPADARPPFTAPSPQSAAWPARAEPPPPPYSAPPAEVAPPTAPFDPPAAGYGPPPPSVQPQFSPVQPQFSPVQPQFSPVQAAGYPQTAPYPLVPGPPTYDPAAVAQQYSAPPTSGPYGYGMPMMMSAIPAPPPAKRGRVGMIVLSILTTLFLVASGILGTLFVLKNKEADKLTSQVTQLTGDASSAKAKSETLQKDLDNTKRDLTDSKAQLDEVTAQKKAIADCLNGISAYGQEVAKAGSNTPAAKAKLADLNKKCNEADKYL
jgi:hypothetical protein